MATGLVLGAAGCISPRTGMLSSVTGTVSRIRPATSTNSSGSLARSPYQSASRSGGQSSAMFAKPRAPNTITRSCRGMRLAPNGASSA